MLLAVPLLLAGSPRRAARLDTSITVREPPRSWPDAGLDPEGERVLLQMVVREVLPDGGVSPLPRSLFDGKPMGGLWR